MVCVLPLLTDTCRTLDERFIALASAIDSLSKVKTVVDTKWKQTKARSMILTAALTYDLYHGPLPGTEYVVALLGVSALAQLGKNIYHQTSTSDV